MIQSIRKAFAMLFILALAGCASVEPGPSDNEKLASYLNAGGLTTEETDRGLVVYLPSLFFESGSADLKPEAQEKIRYIGNAINEEYVANRQIAVEGHTDSAGNDEFNMDLSKRRAESVSDELVFSRVPTERIEISWYGETVPLAPNDNVDGTPNPDGRAKNRRVEFIILNPVTQ
ncbi:MAG: OmpA family protein [Acidiferrobacterales bacterium]|nr:OmpA family protein [Acidiferrobacterales bacterium]